MQTAKLHTKPKRNMPKTNDRVFPKPKMLELGAEIMKYEICITGKYTIEAETKKKAIWCAIKSVELDIQRCKESVAEAERNFYIETKES